MKSEWNLTLQGLLENGCSWILRKDCSLVVCSLTFVAIQANRVIRMFKLPASGNRKSGLNLPAYVVFDNDKQCLVGKMLNLVSACSQI